MPKGIRFDCAKAAAFVAWELVTTSPGAPEETMREKLTEIVHHAIKESGRRRARRFSCLGCFRTLHFRDAQEGRQVKCPFCGKKQPAPEREGRN